ncbi:hypothetical protein [Streptomyces cucumeris]|uniref:hypothetical protein n=1 Tax=Streptomyces cucumeris TaxID=2962890 RepID=UPI003D756D8D
MSQPPPPGNPYGAVPGAGYGAPQAPAAPQVQQAPQPVPGAPAHPGAYGQPGPYGLPGGHPQPGAYPQPGVHPQAAAHGQHTCRVCGGFPAADVTFRSHQGLVLMMAFRKLEGPFCRICGTSVFRDMMSRTLWQGWWSPFSAALFNPFTIIADLVARSKVNKLPDPGHDQFGARPAVGEPVFRRPASFVVLLPVLWVLSLFVLAALG